MWPTELSYASEALPARPSSSNPLTRTDHRRRRTNRSSTDSDPIRQWDGFIEEDYRAGGPNLCPLPARTPSIPQEHPEWNHLILHGEPVLREISRIVERTLHVACVDASFVCRQAVFDRSSQPQLTVLINVKRDDPEARSWIGVAREVKKYLSSQGITTVAVELLDPEFGRQPYIWPCFPSDAIWDVWEKLAMKIVSHVGLQDCVSMGCHRIGVHESREMCAPTILLSVERGSRRNWKVVREKIVEMLQKFSLGMVAVLIREDLPVSTVGDEPDFVVSGSFCTERAKNGYSIAYHHGHKGQGTLGGWLEIQNPSNGVWMPMVITCAHCVLPTEGEIPGSRVDLARKWNQTGVRPKDPNADHLLLVDSPSRLDLDASIQCNNEMIESLKTTRYKSILRDLNTDEFVTPPDQRWFKAQQKNLKMREETVVKVQSFRDKERYVVGKVFASTALEQVVHLPGLPFPRIVDWALIKPTPNRKVGSNDLTAYPSERLKGASLCPLNNFADLVDNKVWKIGRKTQVTSGRYNGLRECKVAKMITPDGFKTRVTWEHCVVGGSGRPFAEAGDSGALVMLPTGEVAGMISAGNGFEDKAYFTPVRDLFDHICKTLGIKHIRFRKMAGEKPAYEEGVDVHLN
ncbi:hypothetical protein BJX61DRAFT_382548 [Aspergillus egyptiacus]|nr:hypothetical protein BJX61DRAFT_382548 [Aspergillus egyptiacus]